MRQRARHITCLGTSNSVLTPHTSSFLPSLVTSSEVEGSKVTNFTGVLKIFEFYLPDLVENYPECYFSALRDRKSELWILENKQ